VRIVDRVRGFVIGHMQRPLERAASDQATS
jgi:hypothetical protein